MNNPSQKEKEMLERFDKIFMIYSTNKPIAFMRENPPFNERIIEHPKNIKSFLLSEIRSAVEAREGELIEEIGIIEAEEPSNFPTPQGQEAVYHVCGRISALITSKK